MAGLKSLAKDTALYGVSSIIGRLLNWCLVPLYTYKLPINDFGAVTNLYSWMALLLIILTYGLETGFFRYAANPEQTNPQTVFGTCMTSLAATSSLFFLLIWIFIAPISRALDYSAHPEFLLLMAAIIAIDAFVSVPFANLRYQHRALRFVSIKMFGIAITIVFNLFFILWAPYIYARTPELIGWFYKPEYGVGYILISNLISSAAMFALLIPDIFRIKWRFDTQLWKAIIRYSFPLLILGVAGIMNQTIDKILLPFIISDPKEGLTQLGIYGANYKIAIIMVMFIQAFRYAYEPFIFSQTKNEDKRIKYAEAMKYFILFGLVIFLGVLFYLDFIKYFIDPSYFSGLKVVPIILAAELFFGIFFNLSLWYKLTDRTQWGAYFSVFGLIITLTLNFTLVPSIGYVGCAWAAFTCYGAMMIVSYFIGQHYYPINYDLQAIGKYTLLAAILYGISLLIVPEGFILRMLFRSVLLIVYFITIWRSEAFLRQTIKHILHLR